MTATLPQAPAPTSTRQQLFGLISTWVFALLPANLVPTIIGRLVGDFGVDVKTAGFIATAMTLANAAAVLLLQRVAARGYRALLARAGALTLMVPVAVALVTMNPAVIMVALVIGGLGSGMMIASSSAAVSATANPDRATNTVMIVNRLVVAVAFFLIPLIGGGLHTTLLIMAVPGLLVLVAAQWLPKAPAPDTLDETPTEPTPVTAYFSLIDSRRTRKLGWLFALGFGGWSITDDGVFGLLEVFYDAHVTEAPAEFVQILLGISILCGLIGTLLALPLLRVLGHVKLLAAIFVLSLLTKVGIILGTNLILFSVSASMWGFLFGLMIPIVFGLAAQMSRDGSISVLVNGVYIFGVALGPLVSSALYDAFGSNTLTVSMTLLGLVTAAMMVRVAILADEGLSIHPKEVTA